MKKKNKLINRRSLLGASLVAGGSSLLFSCKDQLKNGVENLEESKKNKFNLKMVTTWPKDFPGLGTSANRLAKKINTAASTRKLLC